MDIWVILEYTASVTVVGLLIWLLKLIFHDKLDARWHYFIWLVLLTRIVVPVNVRLVSTPLSVFQDIPVAKWAEMGKRLAEKKGYGNLAVLSGKIYLWGAVLLGAFYLAVWTVMRLKVASAPKAGDALQAYVNGIAAGHGLRGCKDIRVCRTGTPFICGIVRPVLVLPADKGLLPEPVIVHELLHKKYGDVLVNIGIHAVRVINWFNPAIWLLTASVLNDNEALCDQRVLELCREESEKEYGNLLITMGEGNKNSRAGVGTSNMASSYRNMKTRIRRISELGRVPKGIGLVTACITLVLAVAGVGSEAASEDGFEALSVDSAEELEAALLEAACYHVSTPEEAVFLFLRACTQRSVADRMTVLPEAERAAYEASVGRWFCGQKSDGTGETAEGEPAYFPRDAFGMESYRVYNLLYDETAGSAVICAIPRGKAGKAFVEWGIRLENEDGWKIRLEEESGLLTGTYVPERLLSGTVCLGDFLVEVYGYNEGYAYKNVCMEYKCRGVSVVYSGERTLEGHQVRVVTENRENASGGGQNRETAGGMSAQESVGGEIVGYYHSDSDGNGSAVLDGSQFMTGEARQIYRGGDGFKEPGNGWKAEDVLGVCVRIYVDDVLAEEGEIWSGNP